MTNPTRMRARLRLAALWALATLLAACGSSHDDGSQPPRAQSITLLAGTQLAGGEGQADGPAEQARLTWPQAVAAASDGSVYIGQRDRVRRLSAQGIVSTVYVAGDLPGIGALPDGRVHDLGSLAIGPDGAVHVTAQWSPALESADPAVAARPVLLRLEPDGSARVAADPVRDGADETQFFALVAVAFDTQGRLWVGDRASCRLWRAQVPGARWTVHRRPGQGNMYCRPLLPGPVGAGSQDVDGLAADAHGGVVYALSNGEVRHAQADGNDVLLGRAERYNGQVNRLALDPEGRVLLVDAERHRLQRLQADGQITVMVGHEGKRGWFDGPADQARMFYPAAVAVAPDGAVLVADRANHTLRRIDRQGLVTTVAGLADQAGWRDGRGPEARFGRWPFLVALADGSLLLSDSGTDTLRQVDMAGQVSTLAGKPFGCCAHIDGHRGQASFGVLGPLLVDEASTVLVTDDELLRKLSPAGDVSTVAWQALPGYASAIAGTVERPVVAYRADPCASYETCATTFGIVRADGRGGWQTLLHSDDGWSAAGQRRNSIHALVEGDDGELFFMLERAVYRRAADGSIRQLAQLPDASVRPRIFIPGRLARDSAGRLYVSDGLNHAVRVITTDGRMHKLADVQAPGSLVLVPGGLVVASELALLKIAF